MQSAFHGIFLQISVIIVIQNQQASCANKSNTVELYCIYFFCELCTKQIVQKFFCARHLLPIFYTKCNICYGMRTFRIIHLKTSVLDLIDPNPILIRVSHIQNLKKTFTTHSCTDVTIDAYYMHRSVDLKGRWRREIFIDGSMFMKDLPTSYS